MPVVGLPNEPVPQTVFGDSHRSSVVGDWHFFNDGAAVTGQNGKKSMGPLEAGQHFENVPSEYSKIATGIGKIDAQCQLPGPPRHPRGDAAELFVCAGHPRTTYHVASIELVEHARQVGGIVL